MKDERVLVISKDALETKFSLQKEYWKVGVHDFDAFPMNFKLRAEAETDFSIKQIIPYAIIIDKDGKMLTYQRCGSEQRLKGIHSAGIGGHVNEQDKQQTLYQTLVSGLQRETSEEIGIDITELDVKLIGMINEERTEVGHCHIGVVFQIVLSDTTPIFDTEIGKPQWVDLKDIDLNKFELWSALAIKLTNK